MKDDSRTRKLLEDAARRGIAYRETCGERSVAPAPDAVAAVSRFIEPLPADGCDDAEVLAMLDEIGSPASVAMAGPRFFGFVIGGSLPVTVATNWLSTAWDQNVVMREVTPATATLEQVALNWLTELFGLPAGTGGGFVTGATVANLTALAAARHRVFADAGWNVESDGLIGAPAVSLIVSEEAHPTLFKSLGMLGLGRDRVVRVPTDNQGRMIAARLPAIDGPTIVCTQAGNINTGAIDPIGEICDALNGSGAWVHVDGAFGLWAAVSQTRRSLTDGMQNADSWATDAHKWLNVPYDSGIAFVRNAADLASAMAITADYLPTETEHRNPSDYTPELSRRGRGIDIWAALRSLGRNGVEKLVDGCCEHARRFAAGFSAAGFDVLNDVVLNQVLVTFGDDAKTREVIDAIQRDGTCWCGATVWQGKTAMRISVSSWATTEEDVEKSLRAMIPIARRLVM
ncbi:MAG: pyridoxal-dependent decarboxylase [Gammaproteobacteria bacterium]|nr:pyridoxal-dependent decarboxylase [Gammaproteobacteria bacterium]MDH3410716.1 pyridoxal-dependent decarboxylase [Gammaproteobacteria bacterium]